MKIDNYLNRQAIKATFETMPINEQVLELNSIRQFLHEIGPFKDEPVDFVRWEVSENVVANDYNPNKVAPAEMKLLELSIVNDGYTQPIVTWSNPDKGKTEVIDGFHRNRVGKESKVVSQRIKGFLPVVDIRKDQSGKNDRVASTIRHNRARGKHQIDAMSEIVIELKNRNWRNSRIARELGMDEEEVLRLCQISGMENLFTDRDFSRAWEAADGIGGGIDQWEDIDDDISDEIIDGVRIPNEGKGDRIFHTYEKWECHKAGFYSSKFEGKTEDECRLAYRDFLADEARFRSALSGVISQWKNSCEHYLTNFAMNRIAWLGQAAMCFETGVPSKYCAGFNLLTEEQQKTANGVALEALNKWLKENGRDEIGMDEAISSGRQVEIY